VLKLRRLQTLETELEAAKADLSAKMMELSHISLSKETLTEELQLYLRQAEGLRCVRNERSHKWLVDLLRRCAMPRCDVT
jgi:hypothetical protein